MNCIRRASFAFNGLLALSAALAAAPAFAQAACQQWDMRGPWTLIQSNDTAVSVTLEPTGNGYSGQASFGRWVEDGFWLCDIGSCGKDYVGFSGPAVGTINGNSFELTIYWNNNAIGVYTGQVGPQGLIVGSTFDRNDPRTTAQWHSNRVAACLGAAPAAPARPALALGRVQSPAGTPTTVLTICEYAQSARARNSPAAPSLEKQCKEYLAAHPVAEVPAPAPANVPTVAIPPVQKPHDLVIGRIAYTQDGQRVTRPVVGKPVAITCNYVVNEVANPLVFGIQPWQGLLLIGGNAPQTVTFPGDPRGGQHEARQIWTPSAAGNTPVSCVLNPGFEGAEANSGNNRWNEAINVVAGNGDEAPLAQ